MSATHDPGRLWHGGAAGLQPGDTITPDHERHTDGCPICAARADGTATIDPATPEGWVYATDHRMYARYYASLVGRGTLYRVELSGDIGRSTEDHFPTWRARQATVIHVVEPYITLTMKERHRLFREWGGTELEWRSLVHTIRGSL